MTVTVTFQCKGLEGSCIKAHPSMTEDTQNLKQLGGSSTGGKSLLSSFHCLHNLMEGDPCASCQFQEVPETFVLSPFLALMSFLTVWNASTGRKIVSQ